MLTSALLIACFMSFTWKFLVISKPCIHFSCQPFSKRNGKLVFVIAIKVYMAVEVKLYSFLTHCGRVTQICVFHTVKLGTSASSP